MSNEWLELAWINHVKAILHGQLIRDDAEVTIEQTLTDEQREKLYDLNAKHEREMFKLLEGFVS